jgi:hypothetical protein
MSKSQALIISFMMMALTSASAQSTNSLLGKWEATYDIEGEKMIVSYEFKKVKGKLVCYTTFIKDDKGNGEAYKSLAMTNISLKGGKGKSKYLLEYEGKTYKIKASLKLTNSKTLKVSYSYEGYSDTEIWKKVK